MEISDRVKEIRSAKKMNQAEFAKLLGIGQSTLGMMEVSKRKISERHIKTICSICDINEHWFRTGEGEMNKVTTTSSIIDLLQKEFNNLDEMDKEMIAAWIKLTPEERSVFKKFIAHLKYSQDTAEKELSTTKEDTFDIDQEVESYRKELEDEKKGGIQ